MICCCSVTKLCPTLCDPMDCSLQGFPVLHYLLEFAQTHDCQVGDAIQPSHLQSPPSSPALNLSSCPQRTQHQGLFQWVNSLHQVAKVLELQLQHQSFQWIFKDWFPLGLTGLIYIYLSSRSSPWNIDISIQVLKAESVIGEACWCETWLGVGVRKTASFLWAPGIGFCRDFWAVCRRLPSPVPGLQHLSSSFPPLRAEYFLVSTPLPFSNSFVQGPLVRILDLEDDTMTEIWRNLQRWLWWKT